MLHATLTDLKSFFENELIAAMCDVSYDSAESKKSFVLAVFDDHYFTLVTCFWVAHKASDSRFKNFGFGF